LNSFQGTRDGKSGNVSLAEFVDYYADLSMSLPSDEYFVQLLESTW
jgi:hypothetical protein